MNRVWGTISGTTVAIALAAGGSLYADTVELTNGDTLSGKVVAQDDASVTFDHAVLGQVVLTRDRVKAVNIDAPPEPEQLVPAPQPQPEPAPQPELPPEPAAPPQPDPAAAQQQAEAAAAEHSGPSMLDWFLTEWNNKLTLGLNGASGNTDRQNYYIKFDTGYEDGRDRWTFNSQWFYGFSDGVKNQNQFEANLTKDWLQKDSPWFFFLKGSYKYDFKRAWENRTSGFGGGGYTLTKTDTVEANCRLGFGGTYEYGDINEFTPEALFGGSIIRWKISDRASISGEATYYPSLEDSSVFRIESKLEWNYKIDLARGMSLKIGVENEYDSRTPGDNRNSDLKYYGALVFSF